MQSVTSPGRVEGLKRAATSRSVGNRGNEVGDFVLRAIRSLLLWPVTRDIGNLTVLYIGASVITLFEATGLSAGG